MTIERQDVGPRMSQLVVHGDHVYLAGQVAGDVSASAKGQTEQILAKIDALLARAGSDKSQLLYAQIWLSDIRFYDAMNEAWDAWVDPQNTPARATAESRLASPDIKVEIVITAAR